MEQPSKTSPTQEMAQQYREMAAEALRLAEGASFDELRATLVNLAARWHECAKLTEEASVDLFPAETSTDGHKSHPYDAA